MASLLTCSTGHTHIRLLHWDTGVLCTCDYTAWEPWLQVPRLDTTDTPSTSVNTNTRTLDIRLLNTTLYNTSYVLEPCRVFFSSVVQPALGETLNTSINIYEEVLNLQMTAQVL